jgi:hypothetical protein
MYRQIKKKLALYVVADIIRRCRMKAIDGNTPCLSIHHNSSIRRTTITSLYKFACNLKSSDVLTAHMQAASWDVCCACSLFCAFYRDRPRYLRKNLCHFVAVACLLACVRLLGWANQKQHQHAASVY